MSKYFKFDRQLGELERKKGVHVATLRFPDGSTRAISLRDPRGLFSDAWSLMYSRAFGRFKQPPSEPPKLTEKRMQLIDLIARAIAVESQERLVQQIWLMCREVHFYDGCNSRAECLARYVERQNRMGLNVRPQVDRSEQDDAEVTSG